MAAAILLVDDDVDYLDIAARALARERLPLEVHVARSGTDALRLLGLADGAPAPPPELAAMFLDLELPGVRGWEVLARVRADERLRRLPVVILSSSGRVEDVRRSYDLGANSYVVKAYEPVPGTHLVRAVRYWIELNRPALARGTR